MILVHFLGSEIFENFSTVVLRIRRIQGIVFYSVVTLPLDLLFLPSADFFPCVILDQTSGFLFRNEYSIVFTDKVELF